SAHRCCALVPGAGENRAVGRLHFQHRHRQYQLPTRLGRSVLRLEAQPALFVGRGLSVRLHVRAAQLLPGYHLQPHVQRPLGRGGAVSGPRHGPLQCVGALAVLRGLLGRWHQLHLGFAPGAAPGPRQAAPAQPRAARNGGQVSPALGARAAVVFVARGRGRLPLQLRLRRLRPHQCRPRPHHPHQAGRRRNQMDHTPALLSPTRARLHALIDEVDDEGVLEAVIKLLEIHQPDMPSPNDHEVSPAAWAAIEEAIRQSDAGLSRPHHEIWAEFEAKYGVKCNL
nr:hypothetical protein [Tanacetum cinerariifolium]